MALCFLEDLSVYGASFKQGMMLLLSLFSISCLLTSQRSG